jgi:hypothetical protein
MVKCKLETCNYESKDNLYCGRHQAYFWKEEQEKDSNIKVCNNFIRGCRVVLTKNYEFTRCDACRTQERAKDKRIRVREYIDYRKKNYDGNYCSGKNRNNELCNKRCEDKYCQFHEYLKDYNEEMLNNLTICKACIKWKYLPNGGVCEVCKERSKKSKEKVKVEENIKICKFIDEKNISCTFKEDLELKNGYCGKHQTYYWKEEQEKDGHNKVCTNFIRGCRNVFSINQEYSRCLECRVKEREKDKERHSVKKEKREENNKKIIIKSKKDRKLNDILICSSCKSPRNLYTFLDDEKDIESELFKTCKICRDKDLGRESKEERKLYKQKLENTPKIKLSRYKKNAISRRLSFNLDNNKFYELLDNKCKYCGDKDDLILNGVDRIDSNIGYNEDNCVSCCRYCNYLKRNLSQDDFFDKIKHILSNVGFCNFKYPELFKNHKSSNFTKYKKCAENRLIEFNINEEQFNKIILMNCYLCNKETSNIHKNGIDRIDSLKNYDLNNILPCCGDCNIMKNDFILENILMKFIKIFKNNFDKDNLIIKDNEDFIKDKIINFINLNKNKLSSIKNNVTQIENINSINTNESDKILKLKNQYKRAKQRNDIEEYYKLLKEYKEIKNKIK